ADLTGPYALVTAGASIHWLDWAALMPRLRAGMTPNAKLAVVGHDVRDLPWHNGLGEVIRRHTRSPDHAPASSPADAMAEQGHVVIAGRSTTVPVPFTQSIESYVDQFHSRASLAAEHMPPDEVRAFDAAVTRLVEPWAADGVLTMPVV